MKIRRVNAWKSRWDIYLILLHINVKNDSQNCYLDDISNQNYYDDYNVQYSWQWLHKRTVRQLIYSNSPEFESLTPFLSELIWAVEFGYEGLSKHESNYLPLLTPNLLYLNIMHYSELSALCVASVQTMSSVWRQCGTFSEGWRSRWRTGYCPLHSSSAVTSGCLLASSGYLVHIWEHKNTREENQDQKNNRECGLIILWGFKKYTA